MGKIAWKQALPTGLADAIVWVWFLQTAYLSRFTEQVPLYSSVANAFPYLSVALCLALSAALMASRWDVIPRSYRIAVAFAASGSTGALLGLSTLNATESPAAFTAYLIFVLAYYGSQILRMETLAKCPNMRTLLMALIVSLVSYYLLSALLLLIPIAAYNIVVILAPLAFLYRALRPVQFQPERADRPLWHSFANAPTALLVLFCIAGGLISSHGGSNPALTLTSLFRMPDPAHLAMVLATLGLGILIARTKMAPRAMYYAFVSIVWMTGTLLGAVIINHLPPLPEAAFMVVAGIIGLGIAASFVVDSAQWGIKPDENDPKKIIEAPDENVAETSCTNGVATFEATEPLPAVESLSPIDQLIAERKLTVREAEILHLLAEGRSVPIICERLVISEGTARTHVKHIYQKLGVHNRQELLSLIRD